MVYSPFALSVILVNVHINTVLTHPQGNICVIVLVLVGRHIVRKRSSEFSSDTVLVVQRVDWTCLTHDRA